MTTVLIRDDPTHVEGGHAIVLFRDVILPEGETTLLIEPVTEGFEYHGPRRLDVAGRSTGGFEVCIGPEVVSALDPGIAVKLSLEGVESETLWPALTPIRVRERRVAISGGSHRIVAQDNGSEKADAGKNDVAVQQRSVNEERARNAAAQADLDKKRSALEAERTALASLVATVEQREAAVDNAAKTAIPRSAARHELLSPLQAAVVACILGAGTVGSIWFTTDRSAGSPAQIAHLPSPYLILSGLRATSPDGTPVDETSNASNFRARAETGSSEAERHFWSEWALREYLHKNKDDVAAILTDFAVDLAVSDGREPSQSAARFLWEMAAMAKDCGAIKNIATSLQADKQDGTTEALKIWHARADACSSVSTSSK